MDEFKYEEWRAVPEGTGCGHADMVCWQLEDAMAV